MIKQIHRIGINKTNQIAKGLKEVNSVSSPTAQTIILCQPNAILERALNNLVHQITLVDSCYREERILCDLLLSGGLRVSEVLDTKLLKVNRLGQVFIRGSKGSANKLVTPVYFKEYWQKRSGTLLSPFINISRFSFHKWLIKHEIFIKNAPGLKRSTTHAMRHLHVYLMELMELETKDISKILGHVSLSNINYYLHGK